jgi:transcription antitermination protein NusB
VSVTSPDNTRRLDRDRVLSLLYEAEMKSIGIKELLAEFDIAPTDFTVETVTGVHEASDDLDSLIAKYARGWDIDRMARIDLLALRVGTWELINRTDLSTAIVISEALNLVKKYSTDESGKFANGILSSIANEVRPSA